jgi:hypothetical protein
MVNGLATGLAEFALKVKPAIPKVPVFEEFRVGLPMARDLISVIATNIVLAAFCVGLTTNLSPACIGMVPDRLKLNPSMVVGRVAELFIMTLSLKRVML